MLLIDFSDVSLSPCNKAAKVRKYICQLFVIKWLWMSEYAAFIRIMNRSETQKNRNLYSILMSISDLSASSKDYRNQLN